MIFTLLFQITKIWKSLKCSVTAIKRLFYIDIDMEYNPTMTKMMKSCLLLKEEWN